MAFTATKDDIPWHRCVSGQIQDVYVGAPSRVYRANSEDAAINPRKAIGSLCQEMCLSSLSGHVLAHHVFSAILFRKPVQLPMARGMEGSRLVPHTLWAPAAAWRIGGRPGRFVDMRCMWPSVVQQASLQCLTSHVVIFDAPR